MLFIHISVNILEVLTNNFMNFEHHAYEII